MWVMTSGLSSALKLSTFTTFSCHRRVAHCLMSLSGAFFVTGTQMRRALFRTALDANHVFLLLKGLPSVMVTTIECLSGFPRLIIALAVISASDVRVLPFGKASLLMLLFTAAKSLVYSFTVQIPQSLHLSTLALPAPIHLYTPLHVLGPL